MQEVKLYESETNEILILEYILLQDKINNLKECGELGGCIRGKIY